MSKRTKILLSMLGLVAALAAPASAAVPQDEAAEEQGAAGEAANDEVNAEEPAEPTHKAGFKRRPPFGGPNTPGGMAEEDDRVKKPAMRLGGFDGALGPWFKWKRRVSEEHGLQISGHYVSLYQGLSDSLEEEDDAASGLFRFNIRWVLNGRQSGDEGAFVITLDHRHAYSALSPADLAGPAGYLGVTGLLLNDFGGAILNLNWTQSFNNGNTGILVGRFDPSDYMNVLGYANPWTAFQNLAVLLDPAVAFPDASWGVGAGTWIQGKWWVLGTVNDANGLATDDLEFFDGGSEFFKQASFGWSPSKDERYLSSVNATLWHVDAREDKGIEKAEGIGLNANWTWNERWMMFARAGFSDGSAAIYNQSATVGFIRHFAFRSDLVGLGVNWGDPPDETLSEQVTVEGFYSFQLAQNLAITPSVQYLKDPAFNPDHDEIWIAGLRLRFTF
jgi:porin